MKQQPRLYLELTTARLLGSYKHHDLTTPVPDGSLHLLIPRNNSRIQAKFEQIAACFSRHGGQVVVRYIP